MLVFLSSKSPLISESVCHDPHHSTIIVDIAIILITRTVISWTRNFTHSIHHTHEPDKAAHPSTQPTQYSDLKNIGTDLHSYPHANMDMTRAELLLGVITKIFTSKTHAADLDSAEHGKRFAACDALWSDRITSVRCDSTRKEIGYIMVVNGVPAQEVCRCWCNIRLPTTYAFFRFTKL